MELKTKIFNKGPLFALLAALLFGSSAPFSKIIMPTVGPWMLAGLFYLASGIGLFAIIALKVAFKGRNSISFKFNKGDGSWMIGSILFGGILGPVFLLWGLSLVTGQMGSLLLNMEGVFTALLAWLAFHEHVDRKVACGMALVVVGGVILCFDGAMEWNSFVGPLLIMGACLCWGVDNNLTRKISANDPLLLAAIKGTAAGSINLFLSYLKGPQALMALPSSVLAFSLIIGFLSYGMSLVFFILALRHIGTSRTGAYFSLAPFIGAFLSTFILGETLQNRVIVGFIFMAAGLWLHLTEDHNHEHEHEFLEHSHQHVHDEHHQHEHGKNDPSGEPHTHLHIHRPLRHKHPHYPDIHHRHSH